MAAVAGEMTDGRRFLSVCNADVEVIVTAATVVAAAEDTAREILVV
jgi:hypothetical protein